MTLHAQLGLIKMCHKIVAMVCTKDVKISFKTPSKVCPQRCALTDTWGRQGPSLPRNVQREALVELRTIQRETEVEVIEIDPESDESDGDGYTGKNK